MSETEFEQKLRAGVARIARALLVFVTALVLLFAQSHVTQGYWGIAFAVAFLAVTTLGVPVARVALVVLSLLVIFPPEITARVAAWIKTLI